MNSISRIKKRWIAKAVIVDERNMRALLTDLHLCLDEIEAGRASRAAINGELIQSLAANKKLRDKFDQLRAKMQCLCTFIDVRSLTSPDATKIRAGDLCEYCASDPDVS